MDQKINLTDYGFNILQIETTAACNMACSFCPYPLKEDKKSKLDFKEVEKVDAMKGQDTQYLYNSFRSADGKDTTHDQLQDFWKEENPADYKDTNSKLSSPKLGAICDWFQCEKTRIRILSKIFSLRKDSF